MSLGTAQGTSTSALAEAEPSGGPTEATLDASESRHRLRDLDRKGRLCAAALALAILLGPAIAFARFAGDYQAAADPALMSMRALDVGTSITPLTGQPSTSYTYAEDRLMVMHPGPIHFYLLALPARLIGASLALIIVSVAVTSSALLISAWAIFRQLGARAALIGGIGLAAITYTTGAGSLVHPVSSMFAGYPLLASMVLLWCMLCRDLRLLPLTVGVVTFTVQQHLAVGLASAISVGLVGALLGWPLLGILRGDPERRRLVLRWGALAAAVGFVLTLPMLIQQFFDDDQGNLSALVEYSRRSDHPSLGWSSAFRQAAHVVGLPPLLGQSDVTGHSLLEQVSSSAWISAGLVLALVALIGAVTLKTAPRRAALSAMAGVTLVAGLVNGSKVPRGIEQGRIAFYHWAWPLLLFIVLSLGLALVELVRQREWHLSRPRLRYAAVAIAVVATAAPSIVNTTMDRRSNELSASGPRLERRYIQDLASQIIDKSPGLDGEVGLTSRGGDGFDGVLFALAIELEERGVDVKLPRWLGPLAHEKRLISRDSLDDGLLLTIGQDGPYPNEVPGESVGQVTTMKGGVQPGAEAFEQLVQTALAADEVRLGEELESWLDAEYSDDVADFIRGALLSMNEKPERVFDNQILLSILRDHPVESPRFDPELMAQVLAWQKLEAGDEFWLDVHYMDRHAFLAWASSADVGASEVPAVDLDE